MRTCYAYICRLVGLIIHLHADSPFTTLQVERLVAKLEQLRSDANMAEERAASVSEEAKELAQALEDRRNQLDQRAQNLVMARNKVDKLAQVSRQSLWSNRDCCLGCKVSAYLLCDVVYSWSDA